MKDDESHKADLKAELEESLASSTIMHQLRPKGVTHVQVFFDTNEFQAQAACAIYNAYHEAKHGTEGSAVYLGPNDVDTEKLSPADVLPSFFIADTNEAEAFFAEFGSCDRRIVEVDATDEKTKPKITISPVKKTVPVDPDSVWNNDRWCKFMRERNNPNNRKETGEGKTSYTME